MDLMADDQLRAYLFCCVLMANIFLFVSASTGREMFKLMLMKSPLEQARAWAIQSGDSVLSVKQSPVDSPLQSRVCLLPSNINKARDGAFKGLWPMMSVQTNANRGVAYYSTK